MALDSALGINAYPSLPKERDMSPLEKRVRDSTEAKQEAETTLKRVQEAVAGEKEATQMLQSEMQVKLAEGKAGVQERYAREMREMPEAERLRKSRDEMQNQAFVPSQANMTEMATLFSLLGVLGVAVGRGGKQNSMAALSAVNGMVEGYNAGRQDIYKREKDAFESQLKRMKVMYDGLKDDLERAVKLKTLDKEAGEREIDVTLAKYGADQLKAIKERFGDAKLLDSAKDAARIATETEKRAIDELKRAEDYNLKIVEARRREAESAARAARDEARLNIERQRLGLEGRRVDIAETQAAEKLKKQPKAPSKIEDSVKSNAFFLNSMDSIVPEAEKLLKQGKTYGIGVVAGKVPYDVAQLYMSQEEKDFLQSFGALTNQKLKDQSGATVTGAEFARQRGVLPMRDDSIETIVGKLKNWRRLVAEETAVIGKAYPSTVRQYGIVLDLPREKAKMVPGMTYRTPQGNLVWNGTEFAEEE